MTFLAQMGNLDGFLYSRDPGIYERLKKNCTIPDQTDHGHYYTWEGKGRGTLLDEEESSRALFLIWFPPLKSPEN